MEARAIKRFIRTSPRKIRLVVDLIRGKRAPEAFGILKFLNKGAAKDVEYVLRSAISNLENKKDRGRIEPEDVVIKRAFVDQSVTLKRILPAPMGRAYRIRKRMSHITIVVEEVPSKKKEGIKQVRKTNKGEKIGTEN